mmetsp:Transcript_41684/g.90061  ORF Transcript_41684/g.90061 Transcript_41684/m.90061 type:complete len:84 (+) Transcript_41684:58-309(+)
MPPACKARGAVWMMRLKKLLAPKEDKRHSSPAMLAQKEFVTQLSRKPPTLSTSEFGAECLLVCAIAEKILCAKLVCACQEVSK